MMVRTQDVGEKSESKTFAYVDMDESSDSKDEDDDEEDLVRVEDIRSGPSCDNIIFIKMGVFH